MRIISSKYINIITAALFGTVNKTLLALALKYNINFIGLCFTDDKIVNVEKLDQNLGYIKKVSPESPKFLKKILQRKNFTNYWFHRNY